MLSLYEFAHDAADREYYQSFDREKLAGKNEEQASIIAVQNSIVVYNRILETGGIEQWLPKF